MPALILVGHGSHLSADSSAPVRAHAERIRGMGIFDEVLEAFWKEEPNLRDAIDLVEGDEVFIVPLFLAEGYFTRVIVPRELGVPPGTSVRHGRVIHLCPAVGTHPAMRDLIIRQAIRIAGGEEATRHATLIIIGHGTDRSETSGDTVYRLVEALRATRQFTAVDCGFLDEEPKIAGVLERASTPDVVLVPFFVAEGWHTATTIPEELGLGGPLTLRAGQRIWYAPPVGIMPEMPDAIVDVAASTAPLHRTGADSAGNAIPLEVIVGQQGADTSHGSHERASPPVPPSKEGIETAIPDQRFTPPIRLARDAFIERFTAVGSRPFTFLEISIRATEAGTYRVTHASDADRDTGDLTRIPDRRRLLDTIRYNSVGDYRPLRTRNDLPAGWVVADLQPGQVCETVETIYPSCILHRYQASAGTLEVVSFERWAARQTGIYRELRNLTPAAVKDVIRRCCSSCLRTRMWSVGQVGAGEYPPEFLPGESPTASGAVVIPCREPCSMFATIARESPVIAPLARP